MRHFAALSMLLLGGSAGAGPAQVDAQADAQAERPILDRSAAQVAREGQFLPETLSARIGAQRVSGLFTGGYDTAANQGGAMTAKVEGALFHRVALEVGIAWRGAEQDVSPSVGVRVALLRQERHHVNLAIGVEYKNLGFSESNGEFELAVLISRRWNRSTLFANVVYGQGLNPAERDAEARVAYLYAAHRAVNLGVDSRVRVDLGASDADREKKQLTAAFDLTAGPLATVSYGPFTLLGQVGLHSLLVSERMNYGLVALGGLGAAF